MNTYQEDMEGAKNTPPMSSVWHICWSKMLSPAVVLLQVLTGLTLLLWLVKKIALVLFKVEILMVGMRTFVLFCFVFVRGLEFEIVDLVE